MISRREEKGMKYISVVVPEDIDRELRFACADQATTKSRLVRRLIEQYLDEWREGFEGMGGQIIGLNEDEEKMDSE
jgi:metal-responsive CopG/Arc/MetJ family transcriptional regulator